MNCVNEAPFKIMARRKGEMTEGAIDRDYPHHVELRADLTTDKNSDAALAFCRGLTLALRGHHRRKGDIDYNVWCFANPAHANAFLARFGGDVCWQNHEGSNDFIGCNVTSIRATSSLRGGSTRL